MSSQSAPTDFGRRVADIAATSRRRRLVGLIVLVAVVAAAVVASIALGSRSIAPSVVLETLWSWSEAEGFESLIIKHERVPRTVLALIVGAALGASGVIMQGVTRNPLADPGVLGVQMGAAFAVILGILVFNAYSASQYFWFALVGAVMTAVAVVVISRLASATSARMSLVIAGAALSAMLSSMITLVIVRNTAVFAHYRYWVVGQMSGRGEVLDELWPFALAAIGAALLVGPTLNALALGDEGAASLGVRVGRAQVLCSGIAVLAAAAATAAVGPVAFVGLVGAHLGRLLVGGDHRWLVPYGMLCGTAVLLSADVAGRIVPGNGEIQVGVMTAVVGVPVFVALARRRTVVPA